MGSVSLSTYDEVLKIFYLPAIQEQLNHATILADLIDINEEDISGKDAKIEMHYGRTTGTGARADGATLPTANYQKYKKATVPMKYNYGRLQVTGPTIAATRDERGAYAKALDSEIKGLVADVKQEINRQLWGCGWGIIGRFRSGTSALTLPKKYRGNTYGDGFGSAFGAKYLKERGDGVLIEVGSLSSSSAATISAIGTTDMAATAYDDTSSDEYDTLTNTSPGTGSEGDWFVRPASITSYAASGAHRLEMMGLRGIVTDTDLEDIMFYDATNGQVGGGLYNDPLQGLTVDTYSWFKANVDVHTSGRYQGQRSLTFPLMDTMFDKVEEKAGKDYGPDLILTTRAIRREYVDLCRADRRFVNTMTLDGGWKAIDFNGVPFTVDNDAIDGEIYFLTTKDIQLYRMSDYDWMNKDGAVLSRVSNYDAYEAVLYRYAELGCKRRNSHGVLCDLAYNP